MSRVTRKTRLDPNTKMLATKAMLNKSHFNNFSISLKFYEGVVGSLQIATKKFLLIILSIIAIKLCILRKTPTTSLIA